MTSRSLDLAGRVLGGRYRLLAPLGAGASARVWLAEDAQLHRRVAVKLLHETLVDDAAVRRRFEREARAAAALNHAHLVAVYDVGDDGPFLVTEYLAGGSLRSLLDAGHRLTPSQALLVGLEAARGLEHAHAHGLVHRDIKPANLLFGDDGRLRIADFGLARVLAEAALTEPGGSSLGTARYASPEQARGEAVGPATDIYSLALVLVEAVTGEVPFASPEHPLGGLVRRTERSLPVPPALGPLRGPLERAGRLDPAERPDAGELAVALLATAGAMPRPAPLPLVGREADGPVDGAAADVTGVLPVLPETEDPPPAPASPAPLAAPAPPAVASLSSRAPTFAEPGASPPTARAGRPVLYDQALEEDGRREPRRGLAAAVAVAIVALVVAGLGYAWWVTQPVTAPVPELVGRQDAELAGLVADGGWVLERSEVRRDGTVPGEVVGQEPAPGVELAEGEVIAVEVSLGPTLVPVPADLVGATLDDARTRLEGAGLVVGEVLRTFDESVPAGQVLAVDEGVATESEVPKGTAVGLTVSDGPEPRTVPAVAGTGAADARSALEQLGLVVEVREQASRDVAEGVVIEQTPAADATVERGSTVTLVVSSGLPWINLPDVTGLAVADATDALEEANLVVAGVEGPPNRTVVDTDPAPGVPIQEGREVTLITRSADGDGGDGGNDGNGGDGGGDD